MPKLSNEAKAARAAKAAATRAANKAAKQAAAEQAAEAPRHAVTPENERLAPLTDTAPAIIGATVQPEAETTATYRGLARDAATVSAMRTNFGEISDRDAAFRFFYGSVMRDNDHTATLAEIHAAGADAGRGKRRNPHYAGSAKATDAGAINRAVKAGYFTVSDNGKRLTATDRAKADRFYNGKQ